ncbi:diacylglycerol pyrophosphate phosphatase 1 [Ceratobasidium theobromae]|uniref:Diacylglycerol pyrophosphate phosphatase 1 n=1 Tax=Ceratobasidium theobromae TaxID=1582974 RepID=A0A5N5QNB1_9AGAM|nr:diacylglycerol pyrophosphate phosphatase 1 [Ceratobasidium theobromae]
MLSFGRKGQSSRRTRLLISYLPDWIVTIGLAAAFFLLDKINGFRREFSLTDTTIQHSYTVHERVPNWLLCVICFGAPVVIMPIVNVLTVRSWWDWHNSMLGRMYSIGPVTPLMFLQSYWASQLPVTVGRPRPDAIARCKPIDGAQDHAVYGLVTTAICTEADAYMMKDGWRSFFSGHSSCASDHADQQPPTNPRLVSFAGLGFLSFYLAGKLHLFDERGHTGKAWIALAPLTGALLTAISRTMDYRHHWQDVLVGSAVGLIFAYFAYRQYYPTLESGFSHKPYSPRIPRDDYRESTLPFTHVDQDYSRPDLGMYRRYSIKDPAGAGKNTYPPLGHGTGSEARLRTVRDDDEETAIEGSSHAQGRGHAPAGTEPRPSGEPLVDMYARERDQGTS